MSKKIIKADPDFVLQTTTIARFADVCNEDLEAILELS
jgi:hypothetical protein